MSDPIKLAREGRSKEAFDMVLKSASREADQAFEHEVKPLLQGYLSEAQAKIADTFTDIMDGKFPNSRVEYAIMRYKPLDMTDEEFLEELYRPYEKWVTSVRVGR